MSSQILFGPLNLEEQIASTPDVSGVYALWNKWGPCWYVGSSKNLRSRLREHLGNLRQGIHCNSQLQTAWNMFEEKYWAFTILEFCTPETRVEREQFYIDKMLAYFAGYNLAPLAGARSPGPETRQKMRESQKRRWLLNPRTPEHIARLHEGRRNIRPEIEQERRKKIAKTHTGLSPSDDVKEKMKLSQKTRFGKCPMPQSTKDKIAAANKTAVKFLPEHRKNISEALKRRWAIRRGEIIG